MKVILYMAVTANSYIAKENDDASFVSAVEWKSFRKRIKRVGNIIVGRKTYEIMLRNNELNGLNEIKVVVVTGDKSFTVSDNSHTAAISPKKALEILHQQGFQEALVAGGGGLNTSFMEEGLVDELYLDIEPIILGKGLPLFREAEWEVKLKLLNIKKLSAQEVQLHYKIVK